MMEVSGSKVMYFARTANLSMCLSSFVMYNMNGMIDGCFFINPICILKQINTN
ncbi:hypothetical protein HanXRQr2_Chr14g0656401 [Helianthus annuus]|uniref:Uncharacterized protein n=1 Tax=Helianthus annuus TaxID=4232 RepID=A0A9K3ECW6_HELAN|nr:hypothetical protein HanXRQr2_Chr14g0656401 [Helianthus annuus]